MADNQWRQDKLDQAEHDLVRSAIYDLERKADEFLDDFNGKQLLKSSNRSAYETLYELINLRLSPRKNLQAIIDAEDLALKEGQNFSQMQINYPDREIIYQTLGDFYSVAFTLATQRKEVIASYDGLNEARDLAMEHVGLRIEPGFY
jgi:hypothetical protein